MLRRVKKERGTWIVERWERKKRKGGWAYCLRNRDRRPNMVHGAKCSSLISFSKYGCLRTSSLSLYRCGLVHPLPITTHNRPCLPEVLLDCQGVLTSASACPRGFSTFARWKSSASAYKRRELIMAANLRAEKSEATPSGRIKRRNRERKRPILPEERSNSNQLASIWNALTAVR